MSKTDHEFRECRKKPIVVEFREVRPDETGVETLEGFKPCSPDLHFIMKGVKGELYPIEKKIFCETYEVVLKCPYCSRELAELGGGWLYCLYCTIEIARSDLEAKNETRPFPLLKWGENGFDEHLQKKEG